MFGHFLKVLNLQIFATLKQQSLDGKIFTNSNLNIPLKLFFCPLVTTYYLGFIAKVLQKCCEHIISCNFFFQHSTDQNFEEVEFNF